MKNLAIDKIKILAAMLACITAGTAGAQSVQLHRVFNFKKGDEFYRQTATKSSCIIQMGKSQVHINSNSMVAKAYDVTDANDNSFTFTVTTKKITSSLDVDDKHMEFDSGMPLDNSSLLAKGLYYMIDKPIAVGIDKNGVIASVEPPSVKLANDTLLAFTGIANEQYAVGNRFGIVSDFLVQGKLDKSFTWGDTTTYKDIKTVNKFWVQSQTADFTTIQFSSTSKSKMANTNTTGVYVLSNANGVVVQRVLQSVSVGYIYYKRNFYGSTRRWAISESCYKIK
jgi:hypothetical protein